MSSIAAIDRRCFVRSPRKPAQATPQASPEDRAPRWTASYAMTWRPPLERVKTPA